jgi:short-subunit dehydrogenase
MAFRLREYLKRHTGPTLFGHHSLSAALGGKRVVVTGASSGIGRSVALKVAQAGGVPILVARSGEKLAEVLAEIESRGGSAVVHPCDLSSGADVDALIERIVGEGPVDVLINNAGRSIRRSIAQSTDRFHDFERTMRLNYFGSLQLILGFLPSMRARRSGHVINVSSMGVQTNVPRFSAYVASKAALDAFSRVAGSELRGDDIHFTTVYMPLVRTPMIAPTKIYDSFPALTPDEAADLVLRAVITREKQVTTKLGTLSTIAYAVAPNVVDRVLGLGYRMFPDTPKKGEAEEPAQVSVEGRTVAHLLKGIHW